MIQEKGGLVALRSFMQRWVAGSSIELDYICLAESIQKVRCRHHILQELWGSHELTVVFEDHQHCILWATGRH